MLPDPRRHTKWISHLFAEPSWNDEKLVGLFGFSNHLLQSELEAMGTHQNIAAVQHFANLPNARGRRQPAPRIAIAAQAQQ